MLTTADGGQFFGFDIDQNGDDGVLASARDTDQPGVFQVSVETFNQDTRAITSSFAVETGSTDSYGVDGIFDGDVALVTRFYQAPGTIGAIRTYEVMNPVTAQAFTGAWTPPICDLSVLQYGVNQTTATSVLFAIELQNQDAPDLIVSNIAANTFSKVIHLGPNLLGLEFGPYLAQSTAGNEAVIALSPDEGAVGAPGVAPINVVIDLHRH